MSGFDNVDFAVFAVEAYRRAKGLSGVQVADLFSKTGVFEFLERFGDTLHCLDEKDLIAEIDKVAGNIFIGTHAEYDRIDVSKVELTEE